MINLVTAIPTGLGDRFNQRLIADIEQRERDQPGTRLGVSSGWSSAKDLHTPETALLLDYVRAADARLIPALVQWPEIWGNINRRGQGVRLHAHELAVGGQAENIASGIYYPAASAAAVEFPAIGARFEPRAGLLLLFGPKLEHSVERAEKEGAPRFSVAFNIH